MIKEPNRPKIGIVLSGGGARGIAHIGVFKALEELDIYPEIIAGSSAGSIVGALYAAGLSSTDMEDFLESANLIRLFRPSLMSKGLISLSYLKKRLNEFIPEDDFSALKRPLHIAVSNLNSGQIEIISEGSLFDAILASSAIPLVFTPMEMNDQVYVDGGLLMNFPTNAIRNKCDFLIGVNLMPETELSSDKMKGVLSMANIATRCFYLAVVNNTRPQLSACDVLIEPDKINQYHIFQFNKIKELEEAGYQATMKKAELLKELTLAPGESEEQ